jgi:hypothetical protein
MVPARADTRLDGASARKVDDPARPADALDVDLEPVLDHFSQ